MSIHPPPRPSGPTGTRHDWLRPFVLYCLLPGLVTRVILALLAPENYLSWEAAENYLQRARAVLAGQVPYLDFWDSKPPLWTYTFAGWGALFGVHVLSLKMLIILGELLCLYMLYKLAFDIRPDHSFAMRASLIYAFLPQVWFVSAVEGKYESLTFVFILGAFRLLLRGRHLAAGALIGLGTAFKFNVALALIPGLLYLGKASPRGIRRALAFVGIATGVIALILSPFIFAAADKFFVYTIQNFTVGTGHHLIPYKAISVWYALMRMAGFSAPAGIPLLAQWTAIAGLAWGLARRKGAPSGMALVIYASATCLVYVLFARVGNIQYFNWSVPFLAIIAAQLWGVRRASKAAGRALWLMMLQSLLVLFTWKNWSGHDAGAFWVIVTLGVTALVTILILRLLEPTRPPAQVASAAEGAS